MIIRQLTAFERDAVKEFYLALSQTDRRMRFCATVKDAAIAEYVDRMRFSHAKVVGAFEHTQLIGLAELIPGTEESDMAFAVRADMRGQKIATRLMKRLLIHARLCGIRRVVVLFSSENTPMRRLAVRAGMQVASDGLERLASLALAAPTTEEVAFWTAEDSISSSNDFGALMNTGDAVSGRESVPATTPLLMPVPL